MRTIIYDTFTILILLLLFSSSYILVAVGGSSEDFNDENKDTTTTTAATTTSDTTTSASSTKSDTDATTTTKSPPIRESSLKDTESAVLTSSTTASSKSVSSSSDSKKSPNTIIVDNDAHLLDVIQLNSRNFSRHISDGNIWLVEFYSPHCSHCVEFEGSYSDIARYYHGRDESSSKQKMPSTSSSKTKKQRKIKVGKVNGEIERALVSRFAIDAYPCFFVIDGYRVYKYEGLRLKKNIMTYVEGGYRKDTAIPFLESPMGPLGIFQGTLMSGGHIFLDIFQWSQRTFGLSPLIVGMILFGIMFMGCFFLIVSLALIIPEKPKRA